MPRSVNKVILIGNLGRDAETTFTPSGIARTRFAVATSRSWKDQQTNEWKEETTWTNVVVWRQEKLANYLLKGKQVYVEGRIETRSYEKDGKKQYTTEVVADEIMLLGGRGEGGAGEAEGTGGGASRGGGFGGSSRPAGSGGGGGRGPSSPMGGGGAGSDDEYGGMGVSDDDVPF